MGTLEAEERGARDDSDEGKRILFLPYSTPHSLVQNVESPAEAKNLVGSFACLVDQLNC